MRVFRVEAPSALGDLLCKLELTVDYRPRCLLLHIVPETVNDIYMVHENQDDVIYRIHWSDLTKHPKHEFESGKYGIYNVGGNVNKLVMLSFDGNKLTYINTLEDVPCIREFETNNSSFSYIAGVKTESPTAEHLVVYTKDGNLEMVPLS